MNSLAVLLCVAVAAVSAQYHNSAPSHGYQQGGSYGKGQGAATSFQSFHLEAGSHDGYSKPSYGSAPSYNKPSYSAGPSYNQGSSYGSHGPSYGSHGSSYGSHGPSYGSHSPSYSHGSSYKPSY